ncbi:MAG: hypothetical protein ACI4DO_07290 [Roseburia sp.]
MKNKSKLKRIRQSKGNSPQKPREWLYLCPVELSAEKLAEALEGAEKLSIQVWKEAGVMEIELPEAKSIDFESGDVDLKDEYSNTFLAEQGTKSLFYVTLDPENYSQVEQILRLILEKKGGLFCGDTDDFSPVIRL